MRGGSARPAPKNETKMKLHKLFIISALLGLAACSDDDNDLPTVPDPIPGSTEQVADASSEIIYEVNPRFYGSTGCLAAVTADMQRFADLGVTTLWVMPVNTQGSLKSVGSPYCVRDYKGIDSRMGSLDDLKALVNAAHARGIRVILDWIANHTSWDNAWITEHPEWYTHDADGNIISPEGQSWTDVADLNFANTEMRTAMIDAMTYWVREADIDGFRCDYTDGVPVDFWTEAITAIRAVKPDATMLAETSKDDYFESGFDMKYGWSFAPAMSGVFTGGTTLSSFYSTAASELSSLPVACNVMRYVINHDTASESSLSSLYGSSDAVGAATVLTMMLGGVPMVYTGCELDYSGTLNFFTYGTQTFNAARHEELAKICNAYLLTASARAGVLTTYQADKVAIFSKTNGSRSVLVLVNTTAKAVSVKTPMAFYGATMTEAVTGASGTLPVVVNLEPYAYAVYYN